MEEFHLGPNGGLIYCIEYLEENLPWLGSELESYIEDGYYLIFDCPGQAELYTVHDGFSRIVAALQKWDIRLVSVHLMDSYQCTDPAKFIAASLNALQAMIRLELPHLNILSKVDLEDNFRANGGNFTLEDFLGLDGMYRLLPPPDVSDSEDENQSEEEVDGVADKLRLAGREDILRKNSESIPPIGIPHKDEDGGAMYLSSRQLRRFAPRTSTFLRKFRTLNEKIVELLEDYSMVSFLPMSVKSPLTMGAVLKAADKAIGFVSVRTKASEKLLTSQLPLRSTLASEETGSGAAEDLLDDLLPNRELPGQRELMRSRPTDIRVLNSEVEGASTRVSDVAEMLRLQGKM